MTEGGRRGWSARLARWRNYYLIAFIFFAWGLAAGRYYVFPGDFVTRVEQDLAAFIAGHPDEDTTVAEKILNDANIQPARFLHDYPVPAGAGYRDLPLPGARSRRAAAKVLPAEDGRHRIVVGAFDFEDALWGAILIDGAGELVHTWRLSGEVAQLSPLSDLRKNLYGVSFFPDGSVVYNLQEVNLGIIKRDVCSRLSWTASGLYHHAVSPTEDHASFWTLLSGPEELDTELVRLDAGTGERLQAVSAREVFAGNPTTHILDLREAEDDVFTAHPNDIEPLPRLVAEAHPGFEAGDLLVTHRNTNLIYVVGPESMRIKWWYFGAGDGLHDADWQPDGTITVFDNHWRATWDDAGPRHSDIVSVDPDENRHRVIVDGSRYEVYSPINGRHQFTGHGTVLITSSTQGRVLEIDLATGEVLFDFINVYDETKGRTLRVSEAFLVSDGFFDGVDFGACRRSSQGSPHGRGIE